MCWVRENIVVVAGTKSHVVVVRTSVGSAAKGTGGYETCIAGRSPSTEGGIRVAVGAGDVTAVAGVGDSDAAGEEVAEVNALIKGVGMSVAVGKVSTNLLTTVDLILVAKGVGVDGVVLGWAGHGAAN